LALHRAELHTFWHEEGAKAPDSVERLLTVGRFFNPNKHRYLHCELKNENTPWFEDESQRGLVLPENWPGSVIDTDLSAGNGTLDKLFGSPDGIAVDVCALSHLGCHFRYHHRRTLHISELRTLQQPI